MNIKALTEKLRFNVGTYLANPLFLATGSSWRRFLHANGQDAVSPTNHPIDNHPDLTGSMSLLKVMSASPELYYSTKSQLELLDSIPLNALPADVQFKVEKAKVVALLALTKADEEFNDSDALPLKMELFRLELRSTSHLFKAAPFIDAVNSTLKDSFSLTDIDIELESILKMNDEALHNAILGHDEEKLRGCIISNVISGAGLNQYFLNR